MKLLDPVPGVRDEKLTNRPCIVAVEIDRVSPIGRGAAEVARRELGEIIPVRAEVIVDDVEDHAELEPVRGVDERAKIVGRAIQMRRRKRSTPS